MAPFINGFTDHTTNTGEVEIAYSVGPDNGPTLLMLHGVTSRRDGFRMLFDSLTKNYRVIAMDQRGHGFSGHTPGHYMTPDHGRDIRFFMENVCKESTLVWGHSMGGANAVSMAGDPPEQLRALVLEDPALFGRKRPASNSKTPSRNQFQVNLGLIDEGLSKEELISRLRIENPNEPEWMAPWKADCLTQMDLEILRTTAEGKYKSGGDPVDTLAKITCPVLVVQADPTAGGILPDDYLASVLPDRDDFSAIKIEGAGHNINRDQPEKMLEVVEPWLAAQA
jgi:pimeloyl-ACP methyl ester carboxylesterase